MLDPYKVLGVAKNADHEQLKKAYRKAAKRCHPDSGGSREEFHKMQQAYLVLSNPEKRAEYDETGDVKEDQGKSDPIYKVLAELVAIILDKNIGLHVDYTAVMRNLLRGKIQKMKDLQAEFEGELKKIRKIRQKLTHNGKGEDVIGTILSALERDEEEGLAEMKEEILHHERALTVVRDYQFIVDEAPEAPKPNDMADAFAYALRNKHNFFNLGG